MPVLAELLSSSARQRRPTHGGPWNRFDPAVAASRDADYTDLQPFYLLKHPSCQISDENLTQLGELVHAAEYHCTRSSVPTSQSHMSGHMQHKFDGVYVIYGRHAGFFWERYVCYVDHTQAPPQTLQIIYHCQPTAEAFWPYNDFLNLLEWRWAHLQPTYGLP